MSTNISKHQLQLLLLTLLLSACGGTSVKALNTAGSIGALNVDQDADLAHLPYDEQGFTVFPQDYDVTIYVDSKMGNDANFDVKNPPARGNTAATALQSIDKAQSVVLLAAYAQKSIRVFLKRGSEWPESLFELQRGGLNAQYPLLISGNDWYDSKEDPRPKLGRGVRLRYGSPKHVAIVGIEAGPGTSATHTTVTAGFLAGVGDGEDYLVEDCVATLFWHNFEFGGGDGHPMRNVRVRRNHSLYAIGGYGSAAVGLGAGSVVGMLIQDNIFDLNGVTSQELIATNNDYDHEATTGAINKGYTNPQAHDIYFVVLSESFTVSDVRMRGNLFARTLQSIKGPADGIFDDNLFYDSDSTGFMGPHGSVASNNVSVNGGIIGIGDDNAHYQNTDPKAIAHIYNNLAYHSADMPAGSTAGINMGPDSQGKLGVNLDFDRNVIDDAYLAVLTGVGDFCFGAKFHGNIFNASQFYKIHQLDACPMSFEGNTYTSSKGEQDGNLFFNDVKYGSPVTHGNFDAMVKFLGGTNEKFDAGLKFSDPSRDITSYLKTQAPTASPGHETFLGFLKAWDKQSKFNWNPALRIPAVNTYLRAGHDMSYLAQ